MADIIDSTIIILIHRGIPNTMALGSFNPTAKMAATAINKKQALQAIT
jgi:hypothetical protein